ncbi:MAG: hypothetical protein OEZ00_05250 [Dehalococcoidia bacterium]|nr:hypothetical protein [Dehalococcoidia bacterium]
MSGKSKWLYLFILSLVLVILGLILPSASLLQASPTKNNFDLGYEQGFKAGYDQGYASHIEYRDIIHYVDRVVIKEVVVEKPIELCEFTSLEELKTWLAEDDTDEYVHLVAGKDGVCRQSDKYDCDDYAFQLQRRAAESGFLMSVVIIQKQGKPHMINLTCIGNDIYYIEPQTDRVSFYCHKD